MSNEQKLVSNKVYSIVSGLIADIQDCRTEDAGTIARHTTRDIIEVVLASGLNEVAKPVINYNIEFYSDTGHHEFTKKSTYENYQEGNYIYYENTKWIVESIIIHESKAGEQVNVTIQSRKF